MPLIPGKTCTAVTGYLWVALLCALLLNVSSISAQDVIVRAELNKPVITADESVNLTIMAQGIDAELDASSLNENFEVVGRSSSREISATIGSNGKLSNVSIVRWVLELVPKGQGVFTVPSVKVGDYETQLLTLTVDDIPQGANRDLFLEASVDTTTPWVQSQVLMTLKVFVDVEILDGGLDAPAGEHLTVQRIGEDTQSIEERDGRQYRVTERRFALFPQRSGTVTIDPVTLQVSVPEEPNRVRGFFSPTRKLTRRSDSIELQVQARPSDGAAWWLPAKALSIQAEWQSDPANAQVDQPLTRTLVMRAQGVLQSQLPEISIPAVEGVSLYAEDPQLNMGGNDAGLVSEQRINWALIPQRSGSLTLPEVTVEWFNTLTGQHESARLAAETIAVAPASTSTVPAGKTADSLTQDSTAAPSARLNNSQSASLSDNVSETEPSSELLEDRAELQLLSQRIDGLESSVQRWRALALVTLLGCFLAALFWVFKRAYRIKNNTQASTQSNVQHRLAPLQGVRQACKQKDLLKVKSTLLDWATQQWPESPPTTLDNLRARLPEGAAYDKLAAMQLALYSKDGYSTTMPWLEEQLSDLPGDLTVAMKDVEKGSELGASGAGKHSYSRLPPL